MMNKLPLVSLVVVLAACGTEPADDAADAPAFNLGDDAGTDTSSLDVPSLDVGIGPSEDANTADVAPSRDTGAVCEPGATTCEGDILVTCADDGSGVGRTRCSGRGLVCEETPDGADCVEPDAPIDSCDTLGTPSGPGSYGIDFCERDDDFSHVDQSDCSTRGSESGGDQMFVINIERETEITIDLRDADDEAAIDTILYLRRTCDDPDSQAACSDDIYCRDSDVEVGCQNGVQVRQSRIVGTIRPGTYAVIADHLVYDDFGCGQAVLEIEY